MVSTINRIPRPAFNRGYDYIFVRSTKRGGGVFEPGDEVPETMRLMTKKILVRRRRIGPKGHPWTEARLEDQELKQKGKDERKAQRNGVTEPTVLEGKELTAFTNSGMSAEGWAGLDASSKALLIANVPDDEPVATLNSTGGGWYEIIVDSEVYDKVQGKDAAEKMVAELNED